MVRIQLTFHKLSMTTGITLLFVFVNWGPWYLGQLLFQNLPFKRDDRDADRKGPLHVKLVL